MKIELHCPACACRFAAPPETNPEELIDRMFDEGPRFALGDGETFEDMIFNTILDQGSIQCPDCGEAVCVAEESLSELAMQALSNW
ncbi:MAG: hypothetical protein K2X38_18165 [Gemmataceae bacterium]|nr:hypothetical protein [Gemmataceae bacterium]